MKALLLKDIYIIRFQAILAFFGYFILQAINISPIVPFSSILLILFSTVFVQLSINDTYIQDGASKWDTFLVALPVKKTTIINEKCILLICITIFIFLTHIIALTYLHSSRNSDGRVGDVWFMSFEVYALMALCCYNAVMFVTKLGSNKKYDNILPGLAVIIVFVLCGLGHFALAKMIPGISEEILTVFNIIFMYISAFILIIPGYLAAYLFCRSRIGRREY